MRCLKICRASFLIYTFLTVGLSSVQAQLTPKEHDSLRINIARIAQSLNAQAESETCSAVIAKIAKLGWDYYSRR